MLERHGPRAHGTTTQRLHKLYQERQDNPADLLLNFAIYWAGKNGGSREILLALRTLQEKERERVPRTDPQLDATLTAALLRSARRCLAAGVLTNASLREHGMHDVLEKLGEARRKRRIEEERFRLLQPALSADLEESGPDSPLVPGRALSDVQEEQYICDVAEWKNVRIAQSRSYIRDQALARQMKKAAGYSCQVCGESLANPVLSRRFVHAHHIEPLSAGGPDAERNLVVLCPSCHAKLHAAEIRIERDAERWQVTTRSGDRRPLVCGDDPQQRAEAREQAIGARIVELFASLTRERQAAIVEELRGRLDTGGLA